MKNKLNEITAPANTGGNQTSETSANRKGRGNTSTADQGDTLATDQKTIEPLKAFVEICETFMTPEKRLVLSLGLALDYPDPYRSAAQELLLIINCDSSAMDVLLCALTNQNPSDSERFYGALSHLEVWGPPMPWPDHPEIMIQPFDARPLIKLLKRLADRDPETGLAADCPNSVLFHNELYQLSIAARRRNSATE